MSTSTPHRDLWPEDLGRRDAVAPVAILREQASALAKKTGGIVEGHVVATPITFKDFVDGTATSVEGTAARTRFAYSFWIVAPALGPYQYELLRISHDYGLYPLTLQFFPAEESYEANSEAAFVESLRSCFAHNETKRIVAALLAQVQSGQANA